MAYKFMQQIQEWKLSEVISVDFNKILGHLNFSKILKFLVVKL